MCIFCSSLVDTYTYCHIKFVSPEEAQAEPAGSLIGGGLCLTPFPKTEDWTRAENPSAWINNKHPSKWTNLVMTFM